MDIKKIDKIKAPRETGAAPFAILSASSRTAYCGAHVPL